MQPGTSSLSQLTSNYHVLYRNFFIRCKAEQMVGMLSFYSALGGLNSSNEFMEYLHESFHMLAGVDNYG